MTDLFEAPAETSWDRSRRQQVEELTAENRQLRKAADDLRLLRDRVAAARELLIVEDACDTWGRRVLNILDGDTPGGWPYGGGS